MLKKETIKKGIDAIAARDAEIGYTLTELFDTGRIDIAATNEPHADMDFFTFNGRLVPVKKVNFFTEGSAAIEQKLLRQYGEMVQRQLLASSSQPVDYIRAAQTIRTAGLRCLLRYEIDRAHEQLNGRTQRDRTRNSKGIGVGTQAPALLERLRAAAATSATPGDVHVTDVLFTGAVDADTPAFFAHLPLTLDALMQVAELDLSFFSVRFILSRWCAGTARNLFACLVNERIAGLVYLRSKQALFYRGLEIKYIASSKDTPLAESENHSRHRGVGTFLVAGVWLFGKNIQRGMQEIVVDTERQSLGFYEAIGFKKRRPFVFVLNRPAGYLLNALAVMVDRSDGIQAHVIRELTGWIRTQVRVIAGSTPGTARRDQALAFIKLCLLSRSQPQLAKTAAEILLEYRQRISESEHLLQWAAFHGRIRLVDAAAHPAQPLLVFKSDAMRLHLQGIFHVESANRLEAIDAVFEDASLAGKWILVDGRAAVPEELAWVHHAEHIARIAATAAKPLTSIDLDTQTTSDSYHTACLAVGGVFSLLDTIITGPARRGFAAVRPPGHHAEPNKAMGFCLFNNAALGACYLKHAKGLKRVMIVDIDAHHGNGTQAAFYHSAEVLYFSMHQFPCYPGSGHFTEVGHGAGEGYSVNVPLDKGMGDREFVQVIDRLVDPLAGAYEPEAIIVSCGFDLYRGDRLANLKGTAEGYGMITRMLCRIADLVCDGRIAFIMEGGYSNEGIRECGLKIMQEMCEIPTFETTRLDKMLNGSPTAFASLHKTIAIHKKYWSILNR